MGNRQSKQLQTCEVLYLMTNEVISSFEVVGYVYKLT